MCSYVHAARWLINAHRHILKARVINVALTRCLCPHLPPCACIPLYAYACGQSYATSTYRLHYFETATGLRLILITNPKVPSLRECLRQVYSGIYVEYVTKNPVQPLGTPITSTYFSQSLNKYIRGLPYFLST
jgi:hypothetical protein